MKNRKTTVTKKAKTNHNVESITYMQDHENIEDVNDIMVEATGGMGNDPGVPEEYVTQHNNNAESRQKRRNDLEIAMKGVYDRIQVTLLYGPTLEGGPVQSKHTGKVVMQSMDSFLA